jgi:hypothetical protein
MDISAGELAILHQFSDMAVEGLANRRDLDEANAADPGLDAVVSHPRHAEEAGRVVLCQPQGAPAPAQSGADAGWESSGSRIAFSSELELNKPAPIAAPRHAAFDL